MAPSCLGPNNAYNNLQAWNANVSESDGLREVLFLGMVFIPVYPIALWADYIVFNTIEYWSGDNPIDAAAWPDNFHSGD